MRDLVLLAVSGVSFSTAFTGLVTGCIPAILAGVMVFLLVSRID